MARLNAGGGSLAWGSYLGGTNIDSGNDIVVDLDGNVTFAGRTSSTDFPTVSPLQGGNGAGDFGSEPQDAFVARFDGLPPFTITSISDDTGYSSSDEVT